MYLGKLKTIKDLKNIIDNYNDDEEIVFDIHQINRSFGNLIEISMK
jgi:hypothetical protein